jgi:predicted small integral membrane protein
MAIRYLKTVLLALVALLALLYAGQNLVNLDAALQAVAYVMRMEDHAIYARSLGPAVDSPALAAAALSAIITGEVVAGVLAARGCWDLWKARRAPAATFLAAKSWGLLGCGIGLVVWMGLFGVVGGAYFQMWQTPAGSASLGGAFQYQAMCAFVLLFVNMPDA